MRTVLYTVVLLGGLFSPFFVYAHPGNTSADGGHYCRTNCDYWGVPYGQRHFHGGYESAQPVITWKDWTQKVSVPFKATIQEDSTLLKGQTKVIQAGVNGEAEDKWRVTYTDGVESSKTEPVQTTTKPSVDQITAAGTKEPETQVASSNTDDSGLGGLILLTLLGGGGYIAYRSLKDKPTPPSAS
jgi:hypothetical protein